LPTEDDADMVNAVTSPSSAAPEQHPAGSDFTINSDVLPPPFVATGNGKLDQFTSRDPTIRYLFHPIINGKVLSILL
jgi:hypothetical protein